ncbi:MAG TPA: 4Fe-4S binding protein [Opitutaceae bacterium]|nr:4Fe-4S binding protein [Opitutaceae bacterium]
MKKSFKEIVGGAVSLVTGMRITLDQFLKNFRKDHNVPYPHATLPIPDRYRGHIIFTNDEAGQSTCIACKSCEKSCPSDCIVVEGEKKEGAKKKSATIFELDFTKCSLCGSCVEVCPTDALMFSKRYNLASTSKAVYSKIDLIKDLETRMAKQGLRQPAPAQTAPIQPAPVQPTEPQQIPQETPQQ